MVRKNTVALLALIMSVSSIMAKEHIEPGEFYVVTKALFTTAETISESDDIDIEGNSGGGLGVDVGYTLPYNFAVELDTSYSRNNIREITTVEDPEEKEEIVDAKGNYWTFAMDVTYTMPVTHTIGLMGKIGYEFEYETISKLDIDTHDNGMVYGVGIEYHLSDHYEAIVEYEGSMIDTPRGSSVYTGIKYIF